MVTPSVCYSLFSTAWATPNGPICRERLSCDVAEAGSTFALVPTYTTISRQAIFTGDLPVTYPDSLWTTHPERRRWEAFWTSEGIAEHSLCLLSGQRALAPRSH